jgi:hypothetical protein
VIASIKLSYPGQLALYTSVQNTKPLEFVSNIKFDFADMFEFKAHLAFSQDTNNDFCPAGAN